MEHLLHYVWRHRLYSPTNLFTTDGNSITVIDPGIQNTNAGPDFFNAKIKINTTLWAGNIEIHTKSSDWFKHRHHENRAYDSVILHITNDNDCSIYRINGETIPQLILTIPENLQKNIDWLLYRDKSIPCFPFLQEIEKCQIISWLNNLVSERLERKTQDIFRLLKQYNEDWNEVFFIILTRNFGFGVNSDAFEWLAKSLPFRYIQKQRNSLTQIEALLFGQAGMLEEKNEDHYYRFLQQEYQFLQKKFKLNPLEKSLFKQLRIRPENFPHLKLAQLAAIWHKYDTLFSKILEAGTPRQIKTLFHVPLSDFWNTHYHFKHLSPTKEKLIGGNALNILLINTIVPFLFAWGKYHDLQEYCERSIYLLETLPTEKNNITFSFSKAGITTQNASDSQALIQLKREYCEKKKCLYCRIGFQLMKKDLAKI